ncbi:MAG: hypothetical protein KKH83_02065 [Candidatus Margulisbacteria bacterium]|nr:hypothetical protein [Candidatus Margulisiibacteriota bacterium]
MPAKKIAKKAKGPKPIATVTHWFGKINVAILKLNSPIRLGDKLEFKGCDPEFTQIIQSMQINHKFVEKAAKDAEIGVKMSHRVREGVEVFKAAKKADQPQAEQRQIFDYQPITKPGYPSTFPLQQKPRTAPAAPAPIARPQPQVKPQQSPPKPKGAGYSGVKFLSF